MGVRPYRLTAVLFCVGSGWIVADKRMEDGRHSLTCSPYHGRGTAVKGCQEMGGTAVFFYVDVE